MSLQGEIQIPTPFAAELQDPLDQDIAASVIVGRQLDQKVLLACRDIPEGSFNPISNLSKAEYRCLVVGATALKYDQIASITNRSTGTIRTHLHKVFERLGVDKLEDASSYIPLDASIFTPTTQSVEMDGNTKQPELEVLSDREIEIVSALLAGSVNCQIARQLCLSESTVRSHRMNIYEKLNLKSTPRPNIALRRIAGAQKNLIRYRKLTADATTCMPPIKGIVANLRASKGIDTSQTVVRSITNQPLLEKLTKYDFLTPNAAEKGDLDMPSLVAALLIKRGGEEANLLEHSCARQVIKQIIHEQIAA